MDDSFRSADVFKSGRIFGHLTNILQKHVRPAVPYDKNNGRVE